MNRENILAVADAIEKHSIPDLGFNMADFFGAGFNDRTGRRCGTTACIAGWAHALKNGEGAIASFVIPSEIADWLGINEQAAENLFYASNYPMNERYIEADWFSNIAPDTAVSVLRHLAETGEVDWDRALAEPSK